MENRTSLFPPARKLRPAPEVHEEDDDAFTSITLKNELLEDLREFMVPFSQEWIKYFRATELSKECAIVIDKVIGSMGATQYNMINMQDIGGPSFVESNSLELQREELEKESVEKDSSPRDGAISRRGYHFDGDDRVKTPSKSRCRPFSTPSFGFPGAATLTDMLNKKSKADGLLSAGRISSLPRTDSLPSFNTYRPLSRSESAPTVRNLNESHPPLSSVPRSFSNHINELSPTPLDAVPEAPSPTKSESSPEKNQMYGADGTRFLSPESAKTPPRAFATPEISKEKKRGLAKRVEKLVKKWEDLTVKKK